MMRVKVLQFPWNVSIGNISNNIMLTETELLQRYTFSAEY